MLEIIKELQHILRGVDQHGVAAFAEAVARAHCIVITGQGRSRLMGAAFAMRLTHLGKRAYLVGEPTTPAVGPGCLVIACSGSGRTPSTLVHVQQAQSAGAQVWALTQEASSALADIADHTLILPAAPSRQPGRAAFEQALLIVLDAVVLLLMAQLDQSDEAMMARHANLE